MEEFPDIHGTVLRKIRITLVLMIAVDFFRRIHPKPGQKAVPPALACFLSHVHSDHVSGLEAASFRGPL
jgi:phosphoribosyl 1,2-cyclic phosphodiesterase